MVISLFLALSITSESTYGQERTNKKEDDNRRNHASVDIGLLRSMLDDLVAEARNLTPEKNRPLALVEIADVYWLIDRDVSQGLFISALDSALELKREDQNKGLRRILSIASRRDAGLSKKLIEILKEKTEKDSNIEGLPLKVALDLAGSNPKDAARLTESFSGIEDKNGVAWLLFQIARRDLDDADRFCTFYVGKLADNPGVLIGDLLWFAGFVFGYSEAFGFQNNDPTKMVGFSLREPALNPKPEMAKAFLVIALDKTRKTIERARVSPSPVRDSLGGIALYAVNYLSPESDRYLPSASGEWRRLGQEALSLSPAVSQDEVAKKIEEIAGQRALAEKQPTQSNSDLDSIISSNLADAEKSADACQRDRAYANAAFFMGGAKNFDRALSTVELIKDVSLRRNMLEYIHYSMSIKAAESGNLNEAEEHAKKVSNLDQLALLYVKMANVAFRHKDTTRTVELLTETQKLAAKASNPAARARNYLAAAAVYAEFDRFETELTVREAIKAVNQARELNLESLSVMVRVDLRCVGDKNERWLGGTDSAERFNLYNTLSSFSKHDFIGATSLARNLEDSTSRIKALTSILRASIESQKEKAMVVMKK